MEEHLLRCLKQPEGIVDAVLDTDAFNEIDDQFAIAYMLKSSDRIRTRALYAAPFFNSTSSSPEDGMERSYQEILKVLQLCGREDMKENVFRGSRIYLENEATPVISPAAEHLAKLANEYTPEHPLYVVAIGAITNVASALLLNPEMKDRCVVVWLGGHSHSYPHTKEFNMKQDVPAARVVLSCGVPVVQLPCNGVVDRFTVTAPELEKWFVGKNPLADYLAKNTLSCCKDLNKPWSRVIWDVTAVAWLTDPGEQFLHTQICPALLPNSDNLYDREHPGQPIAYVYRVARDQIMTDLIERLCGQE